jgi:uncharacterized membrane protein
MVQTWAMFRRFRNAFLSGMLTVLPLWVTAFLLVFLVSHVGAPLSHLLFGSLSISQDASPLLEFAFDLLSTIVVILVLAAIGAISRYMLGRFMIRTTEKLIDRLPVVGMLYSTSKQIIGTFSDGNRAIFQRAVLVEFPRKGLYSIGFLTGEATDEIQNHIGNVAVSVFVPTTPNPTSGFLFYVKNGDYIPLQFSVGDALKMIMSGGTFSPSHLPKEHGNPAD